MEQEELKDIIISALALAVAFSIAMSGGLAGIPALGFGAVRDSLIAVSAGFILHELAHRFLARKFGCYAEYRMWRQGLVMALLFSLFGFVFAAPGAVLIHPRSDIWGRRSSITVRNSGLISLAGPVTNVLLAAVFFVLSLSYEPYKELLLMGTSVNIWLALFNMIPFPPLDGSKVFFWSRQYWLISFLAIIAMFLVL